MITAVANGRVNLIGEHTDYNDGWVFPTAIPQRTTARLTTRQDRLVIGRTTARELAKCEYELGTEHKTGAWCDYLQGATSLLLKDGYAIRGFEIEIDSNVPMGSGLSSSAAFEIAVLKAIREAFALDITDEVLARIGQRIENEFVGARVGIMDQMACAMAAFGEALFLDTMTLRFERVPIPLDEIDLIVINSGVAHRISGGGYNQRRAECESAAAKLKVPSLRSATLDRLETGVLTPVEIKRARHVITENARVHAAVEAMKAHDFKKMGQLFYESHCSMRDDYEVSIPEIDKLVELCLADSACYGARLTGGGFGGSIVAITKKGEGARIAAAVTAAYEKQTGQKGTILVP